MVVPRDLYNPLTLIDPSEWITEGGQVVANGTDGTQQLLWNGLSDDHINPALLLTPARPPLVFIPDGHAQKSYLVVRRGTTPDDLTTLGEPQYIDFSAAGGKVCYAQAHHVGDRVIVMSRTGHTLPGPDTWWWSIAVSDDWGQTWGSGRSLIHWGAQAYFSSRQTGDLVHIAATFHPDRTDRPQSIYYLSIHIPTGEVRQRDGTVIANIDGTGLPLSPNDLDIVHAIASGGDRTWTYDCLPDGSPVWVEWDNDTEIDGGLYRSARWNGSSWIVSDIVSCGARMDNRYPPPIVGQPYRGGAMADTDGDVWLSREDEGTWTIERHQRAGDTWTHQETIASSSTRRLVRPFVPYRQSTGPRVYWAAVDEYAHFRLYIAELDWEGNDD